MITSEMKVSQVLAQYPETIEVFLQASPAFGKLKNPLLRKMLTPRVSVAQAAKIANITPAALVAALNTACGSVSESLASEPAEIENDPALSRHERPEFLSLLRPEQIVLVDVREDINRNTDPFKKIMLAVKQLADGQVMHLVNIFEPVPLYDVLSHRGFEHWTEEIGGDWHIFFYRTGRVEGVEEKVSSIPNRHDSTMEEKIFELDVSGLEPPEPMMRILATLPTLDEGTSLLVHHHREPKMLYPHLTERGYEWITTELAENSYRIVIRIKKDD
ncbi:MAG: DUF2249 domain-containing protein [Bacteroidota bacterium]|nr:DUF2249 domain-containing protein [Bacteroidota bacterium]MDP4229883.1 DUF2249 domain-containing protein [Bacteroidota bacterium]MDP4237216.1 DUF2249 domain-containing protein [Bacteroidota bacterium]